MLDSHLVHIDAYFCYAAVGMLVCWMFCVWQVLTNHTFSLFAFLDVSFHFGNNTVLRKERCLQSIFIGTGD